jgi:hypothetical protein
MFLPSHNVRGYARRVGTAHQHSEKPYDSLLARVFCVQVADVSRPGKVDAESGFCTPCSDTAEGSKGSASTKYERLLGLVEHEVGCDSVKYDGCIVEEVGEKSISFCFRFDHRAKSPGKQYR